MIDVYRRQFDGQFPQALHGDLDPRFLEEMAHFPHHLVSGLCLFSAGRKPGGGSSLGPEYRRSVCLERIVARRWSNVSYLGGGARRTLSTGDCIEGSAVGVTLAPASSLDSATGGFPAGGDSLAVLPGEFPGPSGGMAQNHD